MDQKAERKIFIEKIRTLPQKVEETLAALGESKLDTPCGGAGEWTPRQVVHHLADAHMNAFIRMRLVLTEHKPILKPYDQDEWAKLKDNQAPVGISLEILKNLHTRWVMVMEDLPDEAWERTGIHLEGGKLSLYDLLAMYANHCDAHLEQMGRLL